MKSRLIHHLIFLLSAVLSFESGGQVTRGGIPRSFLKVVPPVDIPVLEMPYVDVPFLEAEDRERRRMGKEFDRRFGYTFDGAWNPEQHGVWQDLPNGDRIWQLHIRCAGALSINLTFSRFDLPEGADLFLFGDRNRIGALTSANHQPDRKLGTGLILGQDLYLEYYEPFSGRGQTRLEIGNITHGYKNPFSTQGFGDSDFCEMNVNCPQGEPWQDEKRSVVRIISNGDHCTAALVNNTAQDFRPYILTANHCFNNSSSTWVYSFNWEAAGCQNPSQAIPELQTVTGSVLRARSAPSDFCLMELNSRPPEAFDVFYSGWNAVNQPAARSVFIHHPAGDIKKISFDFQPPLTWGYGVNASGDSTHWRVGNYELATTTEGGSSGCPMYDEDHRIVGQLHGGPASCTNISSDFYGKFSWSWSKGSTPDTRLRDWLDPANTGLLVLDGAEPGCRRLRVSLPWQESFNETAQPVPAGYQIRNPGLDSTFRLLTGGFNGGNAFRMVKTAQVASGENDSLIFPALNLQRYRNIRFSFRQAYRRELPAATDTLLVLGSRDCGQVFQVLASLSGPALVTRPETGQTGIYAPADTTDWARRLVVLDSTWSKSRQLTFAFAFRSSTAAGFSTLWLDEVQLLGDSAGLPPVASISAASRISCTSRAVKFRDASTFTPTSRYWVFEGGNPAFSTLAEPVVVYPSEGTYPVFLRVKNQDGEDSVRIQDYITIRNTGEVQVPFLEAFSATAFPPSGYVISNPDGNRTWVRNATVNAPGSPAGSLMFDNFTQPNESPSRDVLFLPRVQTASLGRLRMRLNYAYRYYQNFGGAISPDTLRIGYTRDCGQTMQTLWKKGGISLATSGSAATSFTPVAADWGSIGLNLDSLLQYPEVSLFLENTFGYGNRIFIDDIRIDTTDPCPAAPLARISNDSVCLGETLVLEMDSVSGVTYSWTGPAGFTAATRLATRLIGNGMAGAYVARMTLNGCTSEGVSFQVRTFSPPGVPVISQNGDQLSGPAGQAGYLWIANGDTLDGSSQTITAPGSGTYVLVVRNAAGCFRASAPLNVVVSVWDRAARQADIRLFPNPVSGELQVNSASPFEITGIENAQGRSMPFLASVSGDVLQKKLALQHLPPGLYALRIKQGNRFLVLPFVKKNG